MCNIKHIFVALIIFSANLTTGLAQDTLIKFDYFQVSKSSSGQVTVLCGLSDNGIKKIRQEYGWLPSGDIVMFEASENYIGPVLSYNDPAFLLNRWSMYGNGTISISFQRADGTLLDVNFRSAPHLGSCVVNVDLLDEVINNL